MSKEQSNHFDDFEDSNGNANLPKVSNNGNILPFCIRFFDFRKITI